MRRAQIVLLLAMLATALSTQTATARLTLVPPGEPGGLSLTPSATQAGGSSDLQTAMTFTVDPPVPYDGDQGALLRDSRVSLPPGLLANPAALPQCDELFGNGGCPVDSQVGIVEIWFEVATESYLRRLAVHVYNLAPSPGELARLGYGYAFSGGQFSVDLDPKDYAPRLTMTRIDSVVPVQKVKLILWGELGDPAHARFRCESMTPDFSYEEFEVEPECKHPYLPQGQPIPYTGEPLRFVSLPTRCEGSFETAVSVTTWPEPELAETTLFQLPAPTGCDAVPFRPQVSIAPTVPEADSPTGLDVDLTVPQNDDPATPTSAHLRDLELRLPEGLAVNPSLAAGLTGCSPTEIALGSDAPVECPDSSKIGTLEAHSPLLPRAAVGSIYLATPHDNPFSSLLALYLVIEDDYSDLLVKVPAEIGLDQESGQLSIALTDSPQLPFSDLSLSLKSGRRAPLVAEHCGTFTSEVALTPWTAPQSGPPTHRSPSFVVDRGSDGGPCTDPARAASYDFRAGTLSPLAGADSPFVLRASWPEGSAAPERLDLRLPPGLAARLAGVSSCADGQIAAAASRSAQSELTGPSCPPGSFLGTVLLSAGAGPTPIHLSGRLYLTGPHRGAPLSATAVVPVLAGPFDLGTVVVRSALRVNPRNARLRLESDRLPKILAGIPLRLRSLAVDIDRQAFIRNPTSCRSMAIRAQLLTGPDSAQVSSPFQLGGCQNLSFRPRLSLRLLGSGHRGAHPGLRAVLRAHGGDANIARAALTLPGRGLQANTRIGTVCTRIQFAGDACPPESIYGFARALTPLLDHPLQGPVYLRSSANRLPDLVVSLRGGLDLELIGQVDAVRRGIRVRFARVPDAPLRKFVLNLRGGDRGLLENSSDLCRDPPRARASFVAHSGSRLLLHPSISSSCRSRAERGGGMHPRGNSRPSWYAAVPKGIRNSEF